MRWIVVALLVSVSLGIGINALATSPVPGLNNCNAVKDKPAWTSGIYDTTTPYQICTEPPFKMLNGPDTVDAAECSASQPDLLDACRYFFGGFSAIALTAIHVGKFKSSGEIAALRQNGVSSLVYADFLLAHLIMVQNGLAGQKASYAKVSSFLERLKTECTTKPSDECNNRLKALNEALKQIEEGQNGEKTFVDALIAATTAANDSSKTNDQRNNSLEAAATEAEKLVPIMQRVWQPIKDALNKLHAEPPSQASGIDPRTRGTVLGLNLPLGAVSPEEFIGRVIRQILSVVGAIALAFFVWGGFKYMLAAGDADKIHSARNMIVAAVSGLAAIFLSYAVLSLIIKALT